MALLPYKNGSVTFNRSRSSSPSTPINRRIIHSEVYSSGEGTLVKSYSYSQIFNKDKTGRTFETTQIQVLSFVTPQKNLFQNEDWKSREPLDSRVKHDGAQPQNFFEKKKNLKSKKEIMFKETGNKKSETQKREKKNSKTVKYVLLPILIPIVAYVYLATWKCNYVLNLDDVSRELEENLFGQNEVINKVKTVLSISSETRDLHTMVFTGGVGVGKSLTSSIISHNSSWTSNKLILKQPKEKDIIKELPSSFSNCGCNLVRVDDLTIDDINLAVNLVLTVRSKLKTENVLLILIFTVHTEDEKKEILSEFKKSFISFAHVPFNKLNRDVVQQCYEFEMKKRGVQIPQLELAKLVDNKMNHIDITKGPVGCKGVSEDVSFYVDKN